MKMKKKRNIFILLLLIILIIFILRKQKSKQLFMKNGRRFPLKQYTNAEKLGKMYINNYIKKVGSLPSKAAVMFDIDDTLLFVPNKGDNLVLIKPMKNLLDFCIKKGLLVIIITARDNNYRDYTIDELNKNSINYSSLYLHESFQGETQENFNNFKSNIKKELFQKYKIVILMSVGDQIIDIIGKHSGYGLKLPNKTDPSLYEVYPNSSQLTKFS